MMLNKRWEKYLFFELVKVFIFFLFSFFFVFSLMDYATHMKDFSSEGKISIWPLVSYYGCQFVKRADILLPLAMLISSIKVLCSLNASKELVALQAAGLRLKLLLRPFFVLAAACSLFNYISEEFILPTSLNFIDKFDQKIHSSSDKKRKQPFYVLHLQDQSKLVYQKHDLEANCYIDVYWIRSFNDIWKIKRLKADPKNPVAEFVDHLVRSKDGLLTKTESFEKSYMKGLTWQKDISRKGMIPIENRKISHLYKMLKSSKGISKKNYSEIQSYFTYKTISPLFSILVVLAIVPFSVKYTRSPPVFSIYCMGIFGYIAFYTFMDSCIIVATHNTINPLIALLVPFSLCISWCSYKYVKTC